MVRGRSELVSARWLFGGAAVTALGLVGAWATLRRLRKRRRRWLDLDEPVAATPMVLPAQETTAQRSIAAIKQLVAADGHPTPAAIGAVTDTERVVVLFDAPRPEPPPGWTATELGWHRSLNDDLSGSPEVLTAGLVTLGTTAAGAEVLLDLAAARSVSVRGEGEAVERLMCSMLWELASQPLDGPTVELYVVGLACAASRVTSSPGDLIDLSTAAELASWPREPGDPLQVFLVDPFGEDANTAELNALVSACATGSGRAVVVAGACEHPAEDVLVPSVDTATWRTMSLRPSQLPDNVDRQLAATLSAVVVGRRHQQGCAAAASVFDPEAEAVSLRSVALLTADDGPTPSPGGGWDGINDDPDDDSHRRGRRAQWRAAGCGRRRDGATRGTQRAARRTAAHRGPTGRGRWGWRRYRHQGRRGRRDVPARRRRPGDARQRGERADRLLDQDPPQRDHGRPSADPPC